MVRVKGKKILIGITGGIAAYKMCFVVRELRKAGAEVRVVMTDSAKEFVSPLTFSTLSGNEVVVGTFPQSNAAVVKGSTWHIELSLWADLMLVAPATANTIAKIAHGFADNAVTTLVLSLRCPLAVAPAMDADMWTNAATHENVEQLKELGYFVLPPDEGELASGLVGPGRLPEVETIVKFVEDILKNTHRNLQGKKILVTAGPTQEPIDAVRFISNRSSGKMGFAVANAAALRGADVTLVSGPVSLQTPRNVTRLDVETAGEMLKVVQHHFSRQDAIIMAAAVADFSPMQPLKQKMKKEEMQERGLTLALEKTEDILESLGRKKNGKILVGFALETHNDVQNAKEKLKRKHLDLVVLNNPRIEGSGFGADTNVVSIIDKSGSMEKLPKLSKFDVANAILDRVAKILKN
ncbi:MAG: bifunctional phosphopantothenoylcysteine decarboxylase/phosphopantothenate--cysteine ligase CoaBC [Bacteroidota bacterium]